MTTLNACSGRKPGNLYAADVYAFRVRTLGRGPRLVLIHGSVTASATFRRQRPLAERFRLIIPDRPGYRPNPPLRRIDFAEQAHELAPLLEDGSHLLGFSYGGVIALLAACERPDAVRSLTVIEPPCFGVARGMPAVDALVAEMAEIWHEETNPEAFLRRFSVAFGPTGQVPNRVRPGQEQGVAALMAERGPWEAEIPLADLRRHPFPKLVCSSGSHPAFEAVCDSLELGLGAERAMLAGAGHAVHGATGFNERLLEFLTAAERPPEARRTPPGEL